MVWLLFLRSKIIKDMMMPFLESIFALIGKAYLASAFLALVLSLKLFAPNFENEEVQDKSFKKLFTLGADMPTKLNCKDLKDHFMGVCEDFYQRSQISDPELRPIQGENAGSL